MDERRNFVRLDSRLHASYEVIGSASTMPSLTKSVGGGGISLLTESRLAPGTTLQIAVQFPKRTQPLRFKGEVIWSGPLLLAGKSEQPRIFETGVRFLEIAPDDLSYILDYSGQRQPPSTGKGS